VFYSLFGWFGFYHAYSQGIEGLNTKVGRILVKTNISDAVTIG
jgi:hypothetical protein